MSNYSQVPKPQKMQEKAVDEAFMKHFGISYRKMQKKDLAFMIMNQSSNVQKAEWTAQKVVEIGLAMKRQRDYYLKLIRKKNKTILEYIHKTEVQSDKAIKEYVIKKGPMSGE